MPDFMILHINRVEVRHKKVQHMRKLTHAKIIKVAKSCQSVNFPQFFGEI